MKLIRNLNELPTELRGGAVSIGNFDGVHQGHARIVESLRAQAATVAGPAVVFTFDPHPVRLLRPDAVPLPLTWADRKAELIRELGVDGMIVYPTDENLLALTPEEFFREIVVERLGARAMVEGPNFFFGNDRAGDIEVLQALCDANDMTLEVVQPLTAGGDYVSSSRLRQLIAAGDVCQAAEMLTRPYRIRGMVTHGAGRGAKIGFPTANIDAIDTILPGIGVYAGLAWFDNESWPTAVNIGPNPTFGEEHLKVEAHLIGYSGSLYGQSLEVDFLSRVRETRPFDSVDELKRQLERDVALVEHRTLNIEGRHKKSTSASHSPLPTPKSQIPMTVNWPRFADIVHAHQRFLLTSHVRPDCDALGSELGMARILEAIGKRVTIVNPMATPPNLAFIDPERRIKVIGEDIHLEDLRDIEVLMVLDTSAWAQLGPMGDVLRATRAKKIIVDHHVSEDDLDAEAFKNTTAEASGRLVVEAAEELGVALTPEMAMPIYAALATDTGWFRFGSVTSGTYRIAAKLLEAGASPPAIYRDLYEQDTLGRVKLRGVILSRTETELDGRLAHTHVLKEDFQRTGALPADTEDAINMTLAIAGVEFAVIFVEQPAGGFKLSFRSRCDVQCNQIAERFNGGGHKAAAGAFIEGSFTEAQPKVLDVVRTAMR